ncbi:hypothetical protein [Salinimicrobium sp. GXAS 041]|uniref:hypothetical protein n=1 Tax=Salinimicrobium sp. GXAS 041 TaxID=3400806 RepID=UPI003C716C93
MDFLDNDFLLYLGLIILFLGFFLWNRARTKKNRERKNRSFRKRYEHRKQDKDHKS